jgi:DNA sulfur modification protein DndE
MKNNTLLLIALLLLSLNSFSQNKGIPYYIANAPFKMEDVKTPSFPDKKFNIIDFGAKAKTNLLNTKAINSTIEACSNAGGGTVVIPEGVWLTGPIEMKSNVNLYAAKGAEIFFTKDHSQYPMIRPGDKGNKYVTESPIYAYEAKNFAITGEGVFDGGGDSWREVKKSKVDKNQWEALKSGGGVIANDGKIWWPSYEASTGEAYLKGLKNKSDVTAADFIPARDFLRPYMVYFIKCSNILLDGVTFKNSPKFVFYPNNCNNLTLNKVNIYNEWNAQNGDGIDISACKNVVLYQCTVNAGDDGICMKSSGKTETPTSANLENIIIAECTVLRAHGGFVIGSNTDGGMNNIFVTNCIFNGSDIGVRVKSNSGVGGLVHNIYIQDISMKNIAGEAFSFTTDYLNLESGKDKAAAMPTESDKVPEFTNFFCKNITCTGASRAFLLSGLPQKKINHLYFENITINSGSGFECTESEDIFLKNVKITSGESNPFKTNGCTGIHINE